jgi:hypothetical protein
MDSFLLRNNYFGGVTVKGLKLNQNGILVTFMQYDYFWL